MGKDVRGDSEVRLPENRGGKVPEIQLKRGMERGLQAIESLALVGVGDVRIREKGMSRLEAV